MRMASPSRSLVVRRVRRAAATAPTWLARIVSRLEWKAPPRGPRLRSPVPGELDQLGLLAQQLQTAREAYLGSLAEQWKTRSLSPAASSGVYQLDTQSCRRWTRAGFTSTSWSLSSGKARKQVASTPPTMPTPTTATRSPIRGPASQSALMPGLHRAGQHCAITRYFIGHWGQGASRHHVTVLVRVQAEHPAPL